MIWDAIQTRERGSSQRTFADAVHARQVFDIIVAQSYEHGACVLAIRYGLARAHAGHVSLQKLAKSTGIPHSRCKEILADMREIIMRCGSLD